MQHFFPPYRPQYKWFALVVSCCLCLLTSSSAYAQTPSWNLVMAANQPNGSSSVEGITTGLNGDVYLTGWFSGTIQWGNITLTSAGNNDVFVAKWNTAQGSFTWVKQVGGAGSDNGISVAVSGTNLYVTGSFSSTVNFDGVTLTTTGASDGFVAKLSDAGSSANFIWAQHINGVGRDFTSDVVVNGSSVYVSGLFFSPTLSLGPINIANTTASGTSYDTYVAKLTDAGNSANFVWAQRLGGPGGESIQGLAVSGTSVYVGGVFDDNTLAVGSVNLTNAGDLTAPVASTDVFVAKLTDAGSSATFTWAVRAGGSSFDYLQGLVANGSNIYIVGDLISTRADFGTTIIDNTDPTGQTEDMFVAKLTDTGSTAGFVWTQKAGGLGYDFSWAVAVSGANVYVTGGFDSATATFGNHSIATTNTSTGYDMFVTKLTDSGSTGTFQWVQQAGGASSDDSRSIAIYGATVYIGGYVTPVAYFGNQTITGNRVGISFFASLNDTGVLSDKSYDLLTRTEVYPNPAHSHTRVILPSMPGISEVLLTLTDPLGRVMRTQRVPLQPTGSSVELSLENLNSGIYCLHAQAGNQRANLRLVVE
ncbi:T9SS type A sorting domain-containing protein [Hymenobacter sp. 15J16-1T3B]|uniref:T9SS type A sorting domain-containing protein n=1 Tax=Hymenobacter sp. 15J16-1T3B TaxID=2886941 RepID=UPI001D111A67|nr:T9SS type A sorting domain-containing protein [Hymenobacter sp. 15J16-1T3B]MCC3156580.1 T9SS type A sorting domain-containing protein [Hymenobacter sp. 15J16-1T3B]